MRKDAIERDPPLFVGVETLVNKIAQKTAILRNAFAEHTRRRCDAVGRVLHIRSKVAHRREAQPGYNRIGDYVDVLINAPGLEAAVKVDGAVARRQLAVDHRGKLPLRAGDIGTLALARVANRERVAGIVGLRNRIFRASNRADHHMAERNFVSLGGKHDVAA